MRAEKWQPSPTFERNYRALNTGDGLSAHAVAALAALAATEIARSDHPEELRAHYADLFRTLPAASNGLSFERLSGAAMTTAEARLHDPALAMVRTRDTAQFAAPAEAVFRAAALLEHPSFAVEQPELAQRAVAALGVPEEQRASAHAWLGRPSELQLWNPRREGDEITFTTRSDGTGVKVTLKGEDGQWRLTGAAPADASNPNAGVRTINGEGFFQRFVPPARVNVFDEHGVSTQRAIVEVTRLSQIGDRSLGADPYDRRPVSQVDVIFDDGSKAALYQMGVPYWTSTHSGPWFSLGGDDYSTVRPITERSLYS